MEEYRKENSILKKEISGNAKKPKGTLGSDIKNLENVVFGIKNRPSTPLKKVVGKISLAGFVSHIKTEFYYLDHPNCLDKEDEVAKKKKFDDDKKNKAEKFKTHVSKLSKPKNEPKQVYKYEKNQKPLKLPQIKRDENK